MKLTNKCYYCGKKHERQLSSHNFCSFECSQADQIRQKKQEEVSLFISNRNSGMSKQAKAESLKIRRKMVDTVGYIYCQRCGVSKAFRFDIHHIVYRSERPGHSEIDNPRNLILLCNKCHDKMHANKHIERKNLIEERNLTELFGSSIIPPVLP